MIDWVAAASQALADDLALKRADKTDEKGVSSVLSVTSGPQHPKSQGGTSSIPLRADLAGCPQCQHRSAWGNCRAPIEAGLLEGFALVKHPDAGTGCQAFEAVTPAADPLEARLEALLAMAAIDASDAALTRLRYREDPRSWDRLLDDCERAAGPR